MLITPAQSRIRSTASMMLAVVLAAIPGAAAADRGRAGFIETHRCAVVERLRSIHLRGPRSTSRDRFLVVSVARAEQSYVQCIFFDEDTKMQCEASSGAYGRMPEGSHLTWLAPSRSALHRLGFAQVDPDTNYTREIALDTPPDFRVVASLMLGALHDAYGARVGTRLEFTAPKAVLQHDACPEPVS